MPTRARKGGRGLPEALAAISGAKNVFTEASKLEEYSEDMAGFRATPAVVVRPSSEDEVRRIVALAGRMKVPIVPRGAGTSLTGAAVTKGAIILDMRRMDSVLKVDTVNWYARAQIGRASCRERVCSTV